LAPSPRKSSASACTLVEPARKLAASSTTNIARLMARAAARMRR
jgi:hypothetical protein